MNQTTDSTPARPTAPASDSASSGFTYFVSYGGGIGPDVWDSQMEISAADIHDALSQARRVEEDGAWIFEVEQSDYPTNEQKTIARLQRENAELLAALQKALQCVSVGYGSREVELQMRAAIANASAGGKP